MKHIFGMAKRCLDLNGAKAQKLELDYLRLVYAVRELRRLGNDAQGYLLVMTPGIKQRVAAWQRKYQGEDAVVVETAKLNEQQLKLLESEVKANIEGMVAGTLGQNVAGRSNANVGGQIGEEQLKLLIEMYEPGVVRSSNAQEFPFQIKWDYYGIKVRA
jgi:hypothetical protein